MYVACIYVRDWYIGIISEISVEFDKVFVKFMKEASRDPKEMINIGFQFSIAWDLKH